MPRGEILRVSQIIATKLIANEFVGYTSTFMSRRLRKKHGLKGEIIPSTDLHAIQQSDNPLSYRAFQITTYALCGFANFGSVGVQIGVLSALAPSRAKVITRVAFSAMLCGFISCAPST